MTTKPVKGGALKLIVDEYEAPSTDQMAELKPVLTQLIRNILHEEFAAHLADVSWRIEQARNMEGRRELTDVSTGQVYAEDMNLAVHMLTGYTLTPNSPTAGNFSWADLNVVYKGTDHSITNGATTSGMKYVWWDPTTPTALKQSATIPTLPVDGAILFYNNNGTPVEALKGGMTVAAAPGIVDANALANGAVTTVKIFDKAVQTGKIDDLAVQTSKIGDNQITNAKVGPKAVNTTELADSAVNTTQLANNAVQSTKILDGAVTNTKVLDGAINTAELADNAVQSGKIMNGAIIKDKILDGAITDTKILDGAVTTGKIQNGAVGVTKVNLLTHLIY
jgi:hypothetical protein